MSDTIWPFDPHLIGGPGKNLYISWVDSKYSGAIQYADVLFRKSTDDGLTWGPETQITTDHKCHVGGDRIACYRNDIYITWPYPPPGGGDSLFFIMSSNSGISWIERVVIASRGSAGIPGHISASSGKLHVIWAAAPFPSQVYYKRGTRLFTGIEEKEAEKMLNFVILPNPFSSIIYFFLPKHSSLLKIYDSYGTLVKILTIKGGENKTKWNGKDGRGNDLPAGVYFCLLETKDNSITRKIVLVK